MRRWMMVALVLVAGCLSTPETNLKDDEPPVQVPYPLDCSVTNWLDACTARASPNESPSKTEIDLAVNPTNPLNVFVAAKDNDPLASDCVWSVGYVTKDGGKTWKTVYVGGTLEERQDPTHPLYGYQCITDPILSFDQDGILYYPLQASNVWPGGHENAPPLPVGVDLNAYYLAVSVDGGETFPRDRIIPITLPMLEPVLFYDYPRMVVHPGTGDVTTILNSFTATGIHAYAVTTRDQGRTLDAPAILMTDTPTQSVYFRSGLTAAKDGTILASVGTGGGTAGGSPVRLAVSTDGARSFEVQGEMFKVKPIRCPLPNTHHRCGTFVEFASDLTDGPHANRVYAVSGENRTGTADIFARWSDDKGDSWSEPVRVNQDNTTTAQFMSRVDVGPDGAVHVVYLDRSYAPGDKLYDATHAWSLDGGATWATQRITSVSSDGDLGIHQFGGPFIGDYIGIDVAGGHTYMGFPSTVTGRTEVAVAHAVKTEAAP